LPAALEELAHLYGVERHYLDMRGQRRPAAPEALVRVLQILGAPLHRAEDAGAALQARRRALWHQGLEPATVAWDGDLPGIVLRLPADAWGQVRCALQLDGGDRLAWSADLAELPTVETVAFDGGAWTARLLKPPQTLPWGCHRLTAEVGDRAYEATVIAAPRQAYGPPDGRRTWGVFLPLYALHSERSWGGGDFADLDRLLAWTRQMGGGVVATLPLLAAFLDEPCEPSPYSPLSRLFWNEFYLSIDAVPELGTCPDAQAILRSQDFQRAVADLRSQPLVDYRRQMALKRRVLGELAQAFFTAAGPERRGAFDRFLAARPEAEDYARFRAAGERLRAPWRQWPAPLRDGTIRDGDFAEADRRYHLYVQWLAEEQLGALAARAREAGPGLYLDLPLGVHGDGYDVWRERSAFAVGAAGGCPPDPVFTKGQNWGFPPLHPEGIRLEGYRYVRAFLRHQLRHAGVLRIDHVPVFHRLFWVPDGMEARDGVYVRYPAEELYALFSLESHRHRTLLVGEDLGTVPPEVPEAMARHHVHRMYVIQYALQADPQAPLPPVPAEAVASVNTHDMPPFAAYRAGADVRQRQELGLLGDQDPEKEQEHRRAMVEALARFLEGAGRPRGQPDAAALARSCLAFLAASPARLVLANLEDLWQETEPQNVPSTGQELPNWRRKARYTLEQFTALPEVAAALAEVDRLRQGEATMGTAGG
jgi:4-alpha-glucanotransferase